MQRLIDDELAQWKASPVRKPLIVRGARQVGKTYSVLEFGAREFERVLHVDFSRDPQFKAYFESSVEPRRVIESLSVHFGIDIDPDTTLVFFDEIQLCGRALTALKYFCEEAPQYHVVAAGSLLGVELMREGDLYPVGKTDSIELRPLDFEEFCWAMGEQRLAKAIGEAYERATEPFVHHEKALDLYRRYLIVGGMPEAVHRFSQGAAFADVADIQRHIENDYVADMTKYAGSADSSKILAIWRSLPIQLAKDNPKFQYRAVREGARAREYGVSVEWLAAAGIVELCTQVGEGVSPLAAFEKPDAFKMYFGDTGLLAANLGATLNNLADDNPKTSRFRGAMAENYVMQQLVARGSRPHYWGTTSVAEVDFLVQDHSGRVVPIEVKSGDNTRSRSKKTFCAKYDPAVYVTVSAKNFGRVGRDVSIPLYATWCLARDL